MKRRFAMPLVALLVALGWAGRASAVIKVDMPVWKIYDTAKAVIVGTVAGINPENRVLEVKVAETAKGESAGDALRIQIVSPAELVKQAGAGSPAVVFVGKAKGGAVAVVHLADTWLLAELVANSSPPAWRVLGPHDAKGAFPGRTAALVRLVAELKAGKGTLLNETENKVFKAGTRQLAKLPVAKPTFLAVADFSGDRKPDLLVGTGAGVRLFLATDKGYEDATEKWGLAGAKGGVHACGDVNGDGKVDLLLHKTLWINEGQRFRAAMAISGGDKPLGAAILDVTGDKKPDVAILQTDGDLSLFENAGMPDQVGKPLPARSLWQGGTAVAAEFGDWGDNARPHLLVLRQSSLTRYALDADGGPPADFERLTGVRLAAANKAFADGPKNAAAIALDANGDRRKDFLFLADGGGLLLVNRGFGTFLVNPDAASALISSDANRLPFKIAPGIAWAAADMHGNGFDDVLVLAEDGTLYIVDNVGPQSTQK